MTIGIITTNYINNNNNNNDAEFYVNFIIGVYFNKFSTSVLFFFVYRNK